MIARSSVSILAKTPTPSCSSADATITADAPQSRCLKAASPESMPPQPITAMSARNFCRSLRTLPSAMAATAGPPSPPYEPGWRAGASVSMSTSRPLPTVLMAVTKLMCGHALIVAVAPSYCCS